MLIDYTSSYTLYLKYIAAVIVLKLIVTDYLFCCYELLFDKRHILNYWCPIKN